MTAHNTQKVTIHRTYTFFYVFLWCSIGDNGIINHNGYDIVCFLTKYCHIRAICSRYNARNMMQCE